jgi:hypothetical protein
MTSIVLHAGAAGCDIQMTLSSKRIYKDLLDKDETDSALLSPPG